MGMMHTLARIEAVRQREVNPACGSFTVEMKAGRLLDEWIDNESEDLPPTCAAEAIPRGQEWKTLDVLCPLDGEDVHDPDESSGITHLATAQHEEGQQEDSHVGQWEEKEIQIGIPCHPPILCPVIQSITRSRLAGYAVIP